MQACQFLESMPYAHKAYLYMSTIQDLIWHTVVLSKFVKGIKVNWMLKHILKKKKKKLFVASKIFSRYNVSKVSHP